MISLPFDGTRMYSFYIPVSKSSQKSEIIILFLGSFSLNLYIYILYSVIYGYLSYPSLVTTYCFQNHIFPYQTCDMHHACFLFTSQRTLTSQNYSHCSIFTLIDNDSNELKNLNHFQGITSRENDKKERADIEVTNSTSLYLLLIRRCYS